MVNAQRLSDGRRPRGHRGPRPAPPRGAARRRGRRLLHHRCRCSARSPTRTSRTTAGTWTTPAATPTASTRSPNADVDAPEGWDGGTGAGAIVAVVDTGYDSDHPELAGALWTNPDESCGSADADGDGKAGDCHGWNFTTNSPDVDNGSYGTHGASVSGVVGGAGRQRHGHRRRRPRRHDHAAGHRQRFVGRHEPRRRGHPLRRRPRRRRHQRLLGRRRRAAGR